MEFDGSNDYMQADVSTTSLDGDPSFTADMFVKRRTGTNVGANNGFWGIGGTGQGNGISGWTPTQNLPLLEHIVQVFAFKFIQTKKRNNLNYAQTTKTEKLELRTTPVTKTGDPFLMLTPYVRPDFNFIF